jgi:hypothetical protein
MKIGKITLDGYSNYGNLLQNYALQQVLLRYVDVVDTIWHSPDNFIPKVYWKWGWKEPIKYAINWKKFRTIFQSGKNGYEMVRQGKLRDWADRYIHIRYGVRDLESISDEYDYFVTGSDQVWNPYFSNIDSELENNFLEFASPEKRLSYAASISAPEIPANRRALFRNGINGMAQLSLREEAGAELIYELTGRKAEVHVDPTMLLTSKEWDMVSRMPAWYKGEDYILTYFLGNRPDHVIYEVAKKSGCKVVNLLDDSCYGHYVTGVDEFIWAIKHAKLIYTDSFHGTVFSILYHTPFVVCNRVQDSVTEKMGSRLDTLLQNFKMTSRRAGAENSYCIKNPFDEPNWGIAENVLKKERERSDRYFRTMFPQN